MVDLNDQRLRRQNALDDITETTGLVFPGPDDRLRPVPRPQVRPDPPDRLSTGSRPSSPAPASATIIRWPRRRSGRNTRWREPPGSKPRAGCNPPSFSWSAGREKLAPGNPAGLNDETAAAFAKPATERSVHEVKLVFEALKADGRIAPNAWKTALDPAALSSASGCWESSTNLRDTRRQTRRRHEASKTCGPAPPPTYLLRRGDFAAKGPRCAGIPDGAHVSAGEGSPATKTAMRSSGRRTALADWLVRPGNPLTARVIVNRLWQHHFGRGLVATASDFGTMGEEPSNPDLLDWLATELIAQGWSLKAMHRLIVTSAAFRQSSLADPARIAADPDNLFFGRQYRQRLDGEAIRDALLFASGSLNPAMEGPSIFPELPPELSKLSSKGAVWPVSPRLADRHRRSLYVFVRRNLRYPFFEVFDRPDTNASCPRRPGTTIAPQALSLLNSSLAREAARSLAARSEQLGGDPSAQAESVARLALGRAPDAAERQMMAEFLARGGSMTDLCLALFNTNAFLYVD